MRNKKAKTVFHSFLEIVNESKCQRNKSWVGQGKEFYNSLMPKKTLMYSAHDECKSIVTERFIKSLKDKIYKVHEKFLIVVYNVGILRHFWTHEIKSDKKNWKNSQRFWTISSLQQPCWPS